MESKQVLVMRQFPNMRTGKYCSQAAHASVGAVFALGTITPEFMMIPLSDPFVREWVTGRFKKITLYVKTEQELLDIYEAAAGMPRSLIKDAGLTEFAGVATLTAVGIGPADPEMIDRITGHLKLF